MATAESLLKPALLARLNRDEILRFCTSADCAVVYFGAAGGRFDVGDVQVEVFQKSAAPGRLVCYCFEHSVADVEADATALEGPQLAALIAEKCRAGLDACVTKNPQGACCLGNVRQIAKGAGGSVTPASTASCCGASPEPPTAPVAQAKRPQKDAGRWTAVGALLAAVLSSACCWLPLAFIGAGASVVGVASFFEAYRLWFLGATGLLLAAGFYFVYFRKPRCAPGDACAVPNPRLQRFNRGMLWVATVFAVGFAAFPNYVGVLVGGDGSAVAASAPGAPVGALHTYTIEGMTCEGCSALVINAVSSVDGVAEVTVSYAEKQASVRFDSGARPDDTAVVNAIGTLGYTAAPKAPAGRD